MNPPRKIGIRADKKFKDYIKVEVDKKISKKIRGKFLLISYKKDENREKGFIDFLLNSIPTYALKKSERSLDLQKIRGVWIKASKRFVESSKNNGEFGELIIFHLLELFENAVQVVNKMSLKTSGNMYFHGVDAVHFCFDGEDRIRFFGESKTRQNFSDAIKSAVKDLDIFYEKEKDKFEVCLAAGNLSDDLPPKVKKEIKAYFTSEQSDLGKYSEVHAILLGYESKFLRKLEEEGNSGNILINKVIEKYKKDIEKYIKKIEEKVKSSKELKNKRFVFFILPFKDLEKIREMFLKGLGGS